MRKVSRLSWLSVALAVVLGPGADAAKAETPFSGFLGCANGERVPRTSTQPGKDATPPADSTRSYDWGASGDGPDHDMAASAHVPCYARAGGVWRPDVEVVLRDDVDVSRWSGDPGLAALAHGTYTQPELVILVPGDDGQTIAVHDAADTSRVSHYVAQDSVNLSAAMSTRSTTKLYWAEGDARHGDRLELGTTYSGRSQLRLGRTVYLRPAAHRRFGHCLQGTPPSGDPIAAAFLTIENLRATRRGYDVVFQDPFYLLRNDKAAIFEHEERRCLVEKLEVPQGWTLIFEGTQGSMMHRSVVTSEKELQEIAGVNFGLGVGLKANQNEQKGRDDAATARDGYAYESTKKDISGMRESNTVGMAVGYSRQKLMALVFNEGEVGLSDQFIDKIHRIKKQAPGVTLGLEELIQTFGTHYAYAVTLGANAKMTQSISRNAYLSFLKSDSSFKHNGGVSLMGLTVHATYEEMKGKTTTTSETVSTEDSTFVAVNGNGSWNENGYSAGQSPAPILLDVRPLDTLLTPVYFPDDPAIYTDVRQRVIDHLQDYMDKYQALLGAESLAPRPPAPIENTYVDHEGKLPPSLREQLNIEEETIILLVCEVGENTVEGLYTRSRVFNRTGSATKHMKRFKLRRDDWDVFVNDGLGEISRMIVRDDDHLVLEFDDSARQNSPRPKFKSDFVTYEREMKRYLADRNFELIHGPQKYPNTRLAFGDVDRRLKSEIDRREKYDMPCWDLEELETLASQN